MSVNMLLISGAVKAGTSKTGKKIITAIASCLVIIVFLLIAFTTNVLSIFLNVGHVDLNNFDAKGTPIYQEIRSMTKKKKSRTSSSKFMMTTWFTQQSLYIIR